MMPPVDVHPLAARGFADNAEAYERGRPPYAAAAIAWVADELRLASGATVVDVGAGTGKLARALLETGASVVAVEPLESMRRVLARLVPGAQVLAGAAEAIPLPDDSADAVTAGQAAHWFRPDETIRELERVLRHDGGIALLWNVPDLDDPLQARMAELIAPYREGATGDRPGWERGLARRGFTPLEPRRFDHVHELAGEDLTYLVASHSFVGRLSPAERQVVLEQVRALHVSEQVMLHYRTEVYAFRRTSARSERISSSRP